jgi:Holliday junction resolvasome RuvABC endonuclease subunit
MERRIITRVLAIDQATKISGYSIWDDKKLTTYGKLEVNPKIQIIERMKLMSEKIVDLIDKTMPDMLILEDVQYQKNQKTFQELANLQGVIMAYLFKIDMPFQIVYPTTWKSFCSIKGKKREEQKENTKIFVKYRYKIDVSEDEADAVGIGHWAINNIINEGC